MIDPFNIQGMRCVGEVSNPRINGGKPLSLFEPVAPEGSSSINTLEGWNAVAEKANSRAFLQAFGRYPTSPAELRSWVDSLL